MGSDNSSFELGNTAAVKATKPRVTEEATEPNSSSRSTLGYVDNDQLARLGKKPVLKVCCLLLS